MTIPRRRGKTTSGSDSKAKADAKRDEVPPDRRPIGRAQAEYLAEIADVPAEKLVGRPGSLLEGSYTFSIDAHTRAFNPAGDGGGPGTDWLTDYAYSHAHPSIAVSVINS